ncbi:TonB-dependent receptor [Caulobacter flavus]|uniref:TonB-dependent receptor n=1 Tax=Caulobacter flavus TaxID=1679497 RepID=A0A2N5CTE2_9CAUL|nr:TonB-dependent receptor [Caulobacter flavus]AYV49280.1 TonB-dependent receptor [Caulobacter flavus]PLR14927.1 TonB-dependent receptor [Caulobacter flavus]
MRSRTLKRMMAGGCAYGALMLGVAHAQEAAAPEEPQAVEAVVVTGSRIARQDYVANSPIQTVGAAAIEATGQVTVEKALSQMPQFTGSFGQGNTGSTSTGLNGGQSYASLRGLGAKRTLILLDGRRLQPSNPDGSVDLNIIPEALIENVEVITGGASTAYGSDATAGVVNFKLKRSFNGLTADAQYGISEKGDAESFRFSVTGGSDFAEGKGRAVLSFDYTNRDRALQSARDYYIFRTSAPGLSTIPQGTVLFGANLPTLASINSLFQGSYGTAALTGNTAGRYTGQIGFNTDQTLFSTSGVPVLNFRDPQTDNAYIVNANAAGTSQQVNFGYNGSSMQADLDRYAVFAKVDYDLTDNLKFFSQFTFTDYVSVGVSNPTLASNVYGLTVPVTNPFVPTDFRPILASRPTPNAAFTFYKALDILGPRVQKYSYDVFQFTNGLSGETGFKDWTWDGYVSFSRAKFDNEQTGGASASAISRLLNSPTGGTEYCAGGWNPFGNLTPSAECVRYMSRRTLNQNTLEQRMVEVNVSGSLFDLPAGTVKFAAGTDYRSNEYTFTPDSQLNQPDGTSDILGYSVLRDASGSVDTYEVYGELLVPIVKDLPFVQEFNLDLGYRYSDYSSVGGVQTYKADFDWKIVEPVRLRGGYNRAIRAPSVGELYAPVSTGSVAIGTASSTTTNGDPCDVRSSWRTGANAAAVRSLCLAQGVPTAIIDSYQLGTAQVFALTGGNPDLQEETADTYSFGAVLRSPFQTPLLSRLTASIDWYDIKVKDAIGSLSIVNAFQFCFNSGGSNPTYDPGNYYCSLLTRNSASGVPTNPVQPLLNLGQFQTTGVDVQVDWSFDFADSALDMIPGSFALNVALGYTDKFKIQNLPNAPVYDYVGTIGTGVESTAGTAHPKWKSVTSGTYTWGPASLGLRWRWIEAMENSAKVVTPTSTSRGVKAYNAFDLNGRVELPWDTALRFGVNNLLDKAPPQVGDTEGNYDPQNYDVLGRSYYVGIRKRF